MQDWEDKSMSRKIIIIGAGASGLMAAIHAAGQGANVTILEQNDLPGRKLLATGNGRCNLTNLRQEPSCYRGDDPGFVSHALSFFSFRDTVRFFSSLGIYTVNRDGYLYPRSGQASQVRDLLSMEAGERGVKIRCRTGVKSVEKRPEGGFLVNVEGYSYPCDALILANGSQASRIEGSGPSGYMFASSLGHRIINTVPALVPLVSREKINWHGVRTEGNLSLKVDDTTVSQASGELQLTSYGISGIPVFEISRFAAKALLEDRKVTLFIDFFPDFDAEGLAKMLEERQKNCPYKKEKELLKGLFPDKLIEVLVGRKNLIQAIKSFPLTIVDTKGFSQAQAAAGGVDTSEVDPCTMESRITRGLYFSGEVLDIDGTCGGYNLQWAWSSGALAGTCAAQERTESQT